MAITWDKVQQNPEFQALPPDQKEAARQQYFATVIAPQVGPDNIDAARTQFDSQTGPKTKETDDGGTAESQRSFPQEVGHTLAGLGDVAATAIKSIPSGMVNGAMDLVGRATGQGATAPGEGFPSPELGESGQDLLHMVGQLPPVKATHDWLAAQYAKLNPTAQSAVSGAGAVAQDVSPMFVAEGGGPKKIGVSDLPNPAVSAATQGSDWYQAGLRNGEGHPIAKQLSGNPGIVLKNHNADVGGIVAKSEAGHDIHAPMDYNSLADARLDPNSVYNRLAGAFPDGVDLSADDTTRGAITSAGSGGRITAGTPQAQQQILALKTQLLDPNTPVTGDKLINEMRGLRQDGFANAASDDVDKQHLGRAQLDIASALENHVERNLPQGGDVSVPQFRAARTALAKNYAVQGALRGNDVDISALGLIHRNNPNQLTGGLRTLAEFAEGPGRDVSGVPDRFNAPTTASDVAGVVNFHRPVASTIEGIPPVGSVARRLLTGGTGNALEDAAAAFPTRDPNTFRPLPGMTPPPGSVAPDRPAQLSLGDLAQGDPDIRRFTTGVGANPTPPAPDQGGISLADVLSHGVEQAPPQGLSLAPMGIPQGEGLPFHADADQIINGTSNGGLDAKGIPQKGRRLALPPAGGPGSPLGPSLSLGDVAAQAAEPTGDVAGVGLQGRAGGPMTPTTTTEPQLHQGPGVPEDIAARTSNAPAISHQADEQTGEHIVNSPNGQSRAQESGAQLIEKRSDTAPTAQGRGEGVARTEALVQQAEHRGLKYTSDISVSPEMQRVYAAMQRKGYDVIKNPDAKVNPNTGNLVSDDPRKPVFIVKSQLRHALGDLVTQ